MLCDDCKKRQAKMEYAEMVDGELLTWNLCEECAKKRGVTQSLAPFAGPLVSIVMSLLGEGAEAPGGEPDGRVCAQCGLSYADFKTTGKLGCGACYESFHEDLLPLLRRIHGSTEHTGKLPSCVEDVRVERREIRRLRRDLDSAVRREEYERAAELRDLIRLKEKELSERVDVPGDDE